MKALFNGHFIEKKAIDDYKGLEDLENLLGNATLDEEVGIYSHGITLVILPMLEIMEKKGAIVNE